MSHVARVNLVRTIDETFAVVRRIPMTTDALMALGIYGTAEDAATAIGAATVVLRVGVDPVVEVAATVTAVVVDGLVKMVVAIAPPTSLTDTVQEHDQYLVFEPGSATSERRLWEGKWTVTAAPEAV